ncbi:hypothetical protein O1611_g44 [Lasiodiplodia mahajangana]|uniref:Uncharacterized protein n=1 Tax=Lasiodiplodia mahajangana TaxID=1108764 RepID=A0ACC2K1G6_9PEZI|nr:hypothetical protein O1611_g44 [Lasiodiplodia mahajangana]
MGFGPSGQGREWQYQHADDTRVVGLVATCISTGVASVIILALRFLSRLLQHGRLYLETSDWLLLIAWVFFVTIDVAWAIGTKYGIGRHMVVSNDSHKVQILAVVSEATYILAISFVKFSILALYFKAFPVQKFRYCVWGFVVFVIGWGMSGAVVAVFQCTSIDYVWKSEAQDFCIDFGLRNLISGIINAMTNVFIVAIVMPLVWDLPVTKQKKWLVLFPFAVGASIVRIPYSVSIGMNDETWDVVPNAIVSLVEITVGMLAVSIPTYRPLYNYTFGRAACGDSNDGHVCRLKETLHMSLYGEHMRNDVQVTSPGIHMGSDCGGINVTNHIELVRHTNKSGQWVRVMD